ncbi:phosphoribosylanthranilate isomerase [Natronincola peptidivorans]|uniref:N-(5'-phosphoribosyl)anthranilate isomerase n=1 Tax=Natronincola peptidivorans TaxID=426128 RepID=A0A1I0A4J6_9FIRM|nr:phosphoribosylanthranilate isomerase [Natronincola peptidivorans]SES89001.1 phosphoribosylanthranilate isomerase [Natronincola peptidivorans]
MIRVKICGLTREEDIDYANKVMPDYVGFVFADSKRQVTVERAKELTEKLDKRIRKVGVFVNAPIEAVKITAERCKLDILQFHGEEKPEELKDVSQEIWKSFRIKNVDSFKELNHYKVDGYLLDTYVKGEMGGTGKAFDWNIPTSEIKDKYIILAGGLTPENVEEAIKKIRPNVVDISSGVESNGLKDLKKMKEFIERVRK